MHFAGHHILSVNQFQREDIERVFEVADRMAPYARRHKITRVLEEQLSGLEDIKYINSVSQDGRSRITIEFEVGRNVDIAVNEVQQSISRVINRLPDEVETPRVAKSDPNGHEEQAGDDEADQSNQLIVPIVHCGVPLVDVVRSSVDAEASEGTGSQALPAERSLGAAAVCGAGLGRVGRATSPVAGRELTFVVDEFEPVPGCG